MFNVSLMMVYAKLSSWPRFEDSNENSRDLAEAKVKSCDEQTDVKK